MDLTIAILISLATSILGEFTIVAIICKLFNKKSQGTPYPECNRIKYFNYWKWITKLIKLKFMPLWYKQAFNSHWTSVIFLQKVKLLPFLLSFQVAVLFFVNQIKASDLSITYNWFNHLGSCGGGRTTISMKT